MLSICIPVFNEVVVELVDELHRQMMSLEVPIEIVLIDDASNQEILAKNQSIASKVVNIELSENIGRSKIRNLFLQYAQHEYLLFLDCDVSVPDSFLSNYIDWIQEVGEM
ncbi:MAG: glycosyltransferase family 2 protein [Saprospiraceae bacterium]|nr:glycosyltransferase family 2 protein [Saprospiraceae bacterium]